jgi:hypothetical protein
MAKSLFWFFLVLLTPLAGCAFETVEAEDDSMPLKPLEWGQIREIVPTEWQVNKPIPILTKDADKLPPHERYNPYVKNLTLGAVIDPAETGIFSLRWDITFGVGGASDKFQVDASALQQLSLSADTIRISVVSAYLGITNSVGQPLGNTIAYEPPTKNIIVDAFFAEGMTATDPPTLTQQFSILTSGDVSVPVPKFASAFRILGPLPALASSPFVSTREFRLTASGVNVDAYTGDEIFGVRLAPIPVTRATNLRIINNDASNALVGSIAWELDL